MPRKRKCPSQGGHRAAGRPFVGREDFIAPAHSALKEPQRTRPLVLVYHGGAGIGKSRLRRELVRQMAADPGVVTATLDFDIPIYHQPETALFSLRNSIRETYKVRFPSFDLAYAVLWQKTHPDTALRAVGSSQETVVGAEPGGTEGTEGQRDQETSGWLEPGSLLSRLLDESGKLPLIGLIPKISKLLAASLDPLNPRPLDPSLRSWWERRGERELEDLPQMEPGEIVGRLPKLWAADLKDHLGASSHKAQASSKVQVKTRESEPESRAKTGTVPQQVRRSCSEGLSPAFAPEAHVPVCRAVLFIDSYEKLGGTGDGRQEMRDSRPNQDEWVRDLVKQLPEVLWIICGRQRLRWEEVDKDWGESLSQHQLGSLPDQSARRFLSSCGITNEPIQDAIVKGSQGVPHYLDLAVDTVERTKDEGQETRLTGDSPDELVKQFFRHLDQPEIEALQVLSAPRFWYYGLFENLMAEYQTGYPASAYDDLARFSFVKEGAAPGTRTMHELMREALQEAQSPGLRKRVHLYLHEHHAKQLEGLEVKGITEKHQAALTEAFYHGRQARNAADLWTWFEASSDVFSKARQGRLLLPLYREIVQALETELGSNHPDATAALCRLADELSGLGEYDEAELLFRRALAIADTGDGLERARHLRLLHEFSLLLRERDRLDEAEVLCRRLVGVLDAKPGKDPPAARVDALLGLAGVLTLQGKYAEAEALFRGALATCESDPGPGRFRTAVVLSNLGFLLFRQGRCSEAEPLVRRALEIHVQDFGPNHSATVSAMGGLAVALAYLGRYAEAEALLRRVLRLREETLGPGHNRTAVAMENLAAHLTEGGRYAEAEALLRRALAVFEKKLGSDHPDTISAADRLAIVLARQGRYAEAEPMALSAAARLEKERGPDHPLTVRALTTAGKVLRGQGRHAEAESFLRRGLEIGGKTLGPEHPQTLGTLGELAWLEVQQGRYAKAESLYRDLLAKQERVRGPEHPNVAKTVDALAGICCRDGRYAEAESLHRRALAIRENVFGPDHEFVAETLEGLAKVCDQTGRAAEAQELSSRAKSIRERAPAA